MTTAESLSKQECVLINLLETVPTGRTSIHEMISRALEHHQYRRLILTLKEMAEDNPGLIEKTIGAEAFEHLQDYN